MHRKCFFGVVFAGLIFVLSGAALAQGTISGTVELKKSDTTAPVDGAQVDLFPEDVKGQGQTLKTGPDGKFSFGNLTVGKTYLLSVSASGASPAYMQSLTPGTEGLPVILAVGDGRKVTEDELKTALEAENKGLSEDEKKKKAEDAAKLREAQTRNAKIANSEKIAAAALKDGIAAFEKQDYTTAAAKFDEGYQASPDFEGSAPVFLKNKAISLRRLGRNRIVEAQKGDAAAKAAARQKAEPEYVEAVKALQRGIEIINVAPATSPVKDLPLQKKDLYTNLIETLADMYETSLNVPETIDAAKVVSGYLETEPDVKARQPLLKVFGAKAMQGGAVEASAMAFKKILETEPKNIDALSGATVAIGAMAYAKDYENPDAALLQEAAKYGKAYQDSAPKDHKDQSAVTDIMDNIKLQTSKKKN